MNIFTAMVIRLRAVEDTILPATHGAMTYSAALGMIGNIDSAAAASIHDCRRNKPLTVSALYGEAERNSGTTTIKAGSIHKLRLTGLDTTTSQILSECARTIAGKNIEIGGKAFEALTATTNNQQDEAADKITTQELLAQSANRENQGTYPIRLLSPTVFNTGNGEMPFPLPRLFWGSIAESWSKYGANQSANDMRALIEKEVVLGRWRGESVRVELGKIQTAGCVGTFNYRILRDDKPLRFYLELLRRYAFYSGSGRYTAFGMGQAR